jgi:hypothetical protein
MISGGSAVRCLHGVQRMPGVLLRCGALLCTQSASSVGSRTRGPCAFFITEQKGDVAVGDHEIAGMCTGATLSAVEEHVRRDRGDGGAKEEESVVR